jgi:hypothetical protein
VVRPTGVALCEAVHKGVPWERRRLTLALAAANRGANQEHCRDAQ